MTALSLRPGSSFAISIHLLPRRAWDWQMSSSSSSVNGPAQRVWTKWGIIGASSVEEGAKPNPPGPQQPRRDRAQNKAAGQLQQRRPSERGHPCAARASPTPPAASSSKTRPLVVANFTFFFYVFFFFFNVSSLLLPTFFFISLTHTLLQNKLC